MTISIEFSILNLNFIFWNIVFKLKNTLELLNPTDKFQSVYNKRFFVTLSYWVLKYIIRKV